jgi:two-component system, LytTR family, response regulator
MKERALAIRTLIVDDEPLARQRLRGLLEKDDEIEIVGECGNGQEALGAIRQIRPDLAFLDVQMPLLDGFGVLRELKDAELPVVIFITAHDQYAVKAFEVRAFDYLLKPFDRARFATALHRAKVQLRKESSADVKQHLRELLQSVGNAAAGRLVVKSGGRVRFVRIDEIDWIEAAANYVKLHVGSESHLLRDSLGNLERKLDPQHFVRIHRSTIVNIDRIRELQPTFHGDFAVILRDGTELVLSRGNREKLEKTLGHVL